MGSYTDMIREAEERLSERIVKLEKEMEKILNLIQKNEGKKEEPCQISRD